MSAPSTGRRSTVTHPNSVAWPRTSFANCESHIEHPVVTEVAEAGTYWRAEDYHQEYFRNNPAQGYCMFVVAPKVVKFRKTFAAKRRKSAGD